MLLGEVFPVRPSDRWEMCRRAGTVPDSFMQKGGIYGAIPYGPVIQSLILFSHRCCCSAHSSRDVPNGESCSQSWHRRRATVLKPLYKTALNRQNCSVFNHGFSPLFTSRNRNNSVDLSSDHRGFTGVYWLSARFLTNGWLSGFNTVVHSLRREVLNHRGL